MIALFYKLKESKYGRVLLLGLTLFAFTPFVTHYYLTKRSESDGFYIKSFHTRTTLQESIDTEYRLDELQKHISELEHVKLSLKNELRELEGKRHGLLRDIQEYSNNIEAIRTKASHLTNEVNKRQQELEDLQFAKKEVAVCPPLPFIKPPKDILSKISTNFKKYPKATALEKAHCKLSTCFNFEKCPFGHDFSAYIYDPDNYSTGKSTSKDLYNILKSTVYVVEVSEPSACVYIFIIDESFVNERTSFEEIQKVLHSLKFWQGDGHNHVIVNFAGAKVLKGVDTGRAILVQTSFSHHSPYRKDFDMVVPSLTSLVRSGPAWENSAPQLPASRKYLLSFEGNYYASAKELNNDSVITVSDLKQLSLEANDILMQVSCEVDKDFIKYKNLQICGRRESRAEVLKASTFALIFQPEHDGDQTMSMVRFLEALQYGAVPVVFSDNIILPFDEIIEWKRAAIILHNAQFPQLHFILRTIVVNDLLDIRRQGRFLWETYLSTTRAVLDSTLAVIRTRLSLPPVPEKASDFPSVFSQGNEPVFHDLDNVSPVHQHRIKSPTFYRNFTSNNIYAKQRWNSYPGALMSFPSEPFVPILPSSAAFFNSSAGFQPLGKGAGGAGVEFQKALGGDYPVDQFTIVILTYERELVLIEALGRLAALQYLNKVIVVWNSPQAPSPDLKWPNIGVPIKVLRPEKNSLNNRFLPHEEIETDAVLSMDDDVHLRHDEILFGFRVWREARERIVGFPGRFHAWDLNYGGWHYNSNYSCELSMVLTGAAFFHKYYAYLYTYAMPQAIRDKVDEYTNCEDIAMNFLISHVTRKPPIKVTSRWTFRCPGCPQTLSQDETHFNERHKCINFFVKVYGYMPLLRTQFRADSVLFKTRLPHDKTKCFAYI